YVLWPMAAEASLVSRVQASEAFLQSGHDLGLRHLLTLFSPEILGTPLDGSYAGSELWEDVAYFGLVPLALAGAGVGLAWRRPEVRFLAVGFALSLLLALDSPIVRLAYAVVPGLRLFRLPGRILFVTAFFGVTLAGVGLHELRERLSRRSHRGAAWVSVALFAIMAGEGVAYAHRYLDTAPASFVRPDTDLGQFLSADRSTFRVAPVGRTAVSYGSAAAMGLALVTGYEPYNLSRYQQYFRLLQSGADGGNEAAVWTDLHQVERWDLLDALNVKYLLSSHPLTLPADRFEFVQRFERQPVYVLYKGVRQTDVWLYRNLRARTRAYFVEKVAVVPNHGAALAMLAKSSLDGLAIVEEMSFAGHLGVPSPRDRARVAKAAGGFVEVDTLSETERYLVVSESWHPGWRGFLDGKEIPLHIADVTLLGASIPAGRHHLTLMFRPLHFSAAIATSLVALGLFLLGIMRWIQKGLRERRRGEDEPLAKAIAQERTVDAL
ncbi:MAG TPA: hypothetical protein VIM14_18180, partial [Polyangia bacterium]